MFHLKMVALHQNPNADEKVQEVKADMKDEDCKRLFQRFLNHMKARSWDEFKRFLRDLENDQEVRIVKEQIKEQCKGPFNRFLNHANSLLVQFENHSNRPNLSERPRR